MIIIIINIIMNNGKLWLWNFRPWKGGKKCMLEWDWTSDLWWPLVGLLPRELGLYSYDEYMLVIIIFLISSKKLQQIVFKHFLKILGNIDSLGFQSCLENVYGFLGGCVVVAQPEEGILLLYSSTIKWWAFYIVL